ncbi:MAG: hypothetical protein K8S15_00325 [Candidatus Aegiribacteria sp.]|nr:hypothetical protein [Candidatus Aegiribacteria sp.]
MSFLPLMVRVITPFFILALLMLSATPLLSDSPPANTLPVIAQRPSYLDVDTGFLCLLSWMGFDGIHCGDYRAWQMEEDIVPPAEATGMYLCLAPGEILEWGHYPDTWAAKNQR